MENAFGEIQEVDQTVTYIDPDGTQLNYIAHGDRDSIEVIMPHAEVRDVQYATQSIMEFNYREVTVGVVNPEGILFVPEDAKELVRDYRYELSIITDDIHVILDWNTVDGACMIKGDLVLTVRHAQPEDMNNSQKRIVGDRLAISATLQIDGEYVTQLGGKAYIAVKTEEGVNVYYVDTHGRTTLIESAYRDGETHTAVNHFSIYMYTDDKVSEGSSLVWMVLIAIAIVLILILVFVWRRKYKG